MGSRPIRASHRPDGSSILDTVEIGLTTGAADSILCDRLPPQSGRHWLTGLPRVAIRGLFFAVNRTAFLIDGFNLYHSAREAGKATRGHGTKWLDIRALCESYLHLVGSGAARPLRITRADESQPTPRF
jgi:hypothetical protein